jgi:glycosyltransferase involved in cell wall biosynthesis
MKSTVSTRSPLVSIITPSYNQSDFIEETICSVLSQSYPYIEYIVIDGASTDGTLSILSDYKDKFSALISEPDTGQACAINKGITLCKGDIIGWINSDDILYQHTVDAVVAAFNSNPDAEVVYGNADYGDSVENISHTIFGRSFEFIHAFRRLTIPMPQQGCFWRRSALIKCGFLNEDWQYVLDRDYFIRLSDRCSLLYIDRSLGLFRSHPNSKSVLLSVKWSSELIRLYSFYFTSFSFSHPIFHYKSEVMAAVFSSAALLAVKSKHYTLGLKYLLIAFNTDPLLLLRPFFLSRTFLKQ